MSTWHSTMDARAEVHDARAKQAQAEEAQRVAEEVARRAEERAQAETDRADGAEAHRRALLVEFAIDPTLPGDVVNRITDCLIDRLNTGLPVDRVAEAAREHANDHQEDQ